MIYKLASPVEKPIILSNLIHMLTTGVQAPVEGCDMDIPKLSQRIYFDYYIL